MIEEFMSMSWKHQNAALGSVMTSCWFFVSLCMTLQKILQTYMYTYTYIQTYTHTHAYMHKQVHAYILSYIPYTCCFLREPKYIRSHPKRRTNIQFAHKDYNAYVLRSCFVPTSYVCTTCISAGFVFTTQAHKDGALLACSRPDGTFGHHLSAANSRACQPR